MGIDEEGPVPDVLDEDNGIIVEPPNVALSPRVQAAIVQMHCLMIIIMGLIYTIWSFQYCHNNVTIIIISL